MIFVGFVGFFVLLLHILQLTVDFLAAAFEFADAFSDGTGKIGQFFGSKQQHQHHQDNDEFRNAGGAKSKRGNCIHMESYVETCWIIPHFRLISSAMSTHFSLSFLNALGGSPLEMAVVLLAVLILFGAKSLPGTLRTLGRWSEQLRQISREIQREINDAGEPFHQAKLEWEESTREHTVERKSVQPDPEAPAPEDPAKEESREV